MHDLLKDPVCRTRYDNENFFLNRTSTRENSRTEQAVRHTAVAERQSRAQKPSQQGYGKADDGAAHRKSRKSDKPSMHADSVPGGRYCGPISIIYREPRHSSPKHSFDQGYFSFDEHCCNRKESKPPSQSGNSGTTSSGRKGRGMEDSDGEADEIPANYFDHGFEGRYKAYGLLAKKFKWKRYKERVAEVYLFVTSHVITLFVPFTSFSFSLLCRSSYIINY